MQGHWDLKEKRQTFIMFLCVQVSSCVYVVTELCLTERYVCASHRNKELRKIILKQNEVRVI